MRQEKRPGWGLKKEGWDRIGSDRGLRETAEHKAAAYIKVSDRRLGK